MLELYTGSFTCRANDLFGNELHVGLPTVRCSRDLLSSRMTGRKEASVHQSLTAMRHEPTRTAELPERHLGPNAYISI